MTTVSVNSIIKSNTLNQDKTKSVSTAAHTSITPFHKELEKAQEKTSIAKRAGKISRTNSTSSSKKTSVELKDIFKRASEKYDISYDFLTAVAKAESDFNPRCVSSAGAKGIMQLMPDECKQFKVTDPFDAEQNIMASAKLLKAHLKKFNGNFTLAAAAYNAGSGAVKKYGGVPPYSETQNYVKKINRFMKEGVKVPNKKVKVHDTDSSNGSGFSTGEVKKKNNITVAKDNSNIENKESFDYGTKATQSDLEKVMVTVGKNDEAITMTYGAYLQYLKLGTTGVG